MLSRRSLHGVFVAWLFLASFFNVMASPMGSSENPFRSKLDPQSKSTPTGKPEDCKGSVGFYSEIIGNYDHDHRPTERWGVVLDCQQGYRTAAPEKVEPFNARSSFPDNINFFGIRINKEKMVDIGNTLITKGQGRDEPNKYPLTVWSILKSTYSKDLYAPEDVETHLVEWMNREGKEHQEKYEMYLREEKEGKCAGCAKLTKRQVEACALREEACA
ncbi:hypothetical protein F5050DRAFT_416146 [Lentinula boryana]|uniref:Secreted protein n=1 Tax=Lentinula boryana TaxID=40481 RepID=A0ABQ8Q8J8_9AGAR|nr:hypothetical protein F5050DRAFT_416146 [Lentinula boryana]